MCDREPDGHEFIRKSLLEEKPILTRVTRNTCALEELRALFAVVESCSERGKMLIDMPRDGCSTLPPRQATLTVNFLRAT